MPTPDLQVFLYGERIGTLASEHGQISGFRYRGDYRGVRLSRSMPVSTRSTGRDIATSWFGGLLPEAESTRRSMAVDCGSRNHSIPGLLEASGLDCAGAVQLTPHLELVPEAERFEALTDGDIGRRLGSARTGIPRRSMGERWALSGQQGKLALHRSAGGQWGAALGGLPTTHVVKPGIDVIGTERVEDQALLEHLTLLAANAVGIPAAESEFAEFDGRPAVVVRRFDRVWVGDVCVAIHQEDLCQALGISSERKYEAQGGPGVSMISELLDTLATSAAQSEQLRFTFATMVMFRYLSGSPDGHAKNFAMLKAPDGSVALAPMYHVASGQAYSHPHSGRPRFTRSAMNLGTQNQFARLGEPDWRQFAADVRLPFELVARERDRIAGQLPDAFRDALASDIPAPARSRIREGPLLQRVSELCQARLS